MGASVFEVFESSLITALEQIKTKRQKSQRTDQKSDDQPPASPTSPSDGEPLSPADPPSDQPRQGRLMVDATVAPQAIRYPTNLSLLNEARE